MAADYGVRSAVAVEIANGQPVRSDLAPEQDRRGPVELPDPLIADERPNWSLERAYDPLLFWRMRPPAERHGLGETNSLGLRGPEVPEKAPGELRILSLGESTT